MNVGNSLNHDYLTRTPFQLVIDMYGKASLILSWRISTFIPVEIQAEFSRRRKDEDKLIVHD